MSDTPVGQTARQGPGPTGLTRRQAYERALRRRSLLIAGGSTVVVILALSLIHI